MYKIIIITEHLKLKCQEQLLTNKLYSLYIDLLLDDSFKAYLQETGYAFRVPDIADMQVKAMITYMHKGFDEFDIYNKTLPLYVDLIEPIQSPQNDSQHRYSEGLKPLYGRITEIINKYFIQNKIGLRVGVLIHIEECRNTITGFYVPISLKESVEYIYANSTAGSYSSYMGYIK
ncbi:MAG: hypothetical protein ABIH39_04120 [Candidatus Margulisiibacteriota bacterium]